ncbi:MAG: ABC transporter permease [Nanoarchaeota archaeon]|nr:ABC transporter permease [Nanoarchaeota archaeon]
MIILSFSNLMRNKGRTFLTTFGILIGVAAIVSLVSISEGIINEADNVLGSLQYITLMEKGALDDTLSHVPVEELGRVSRVRGVKYYTPQINFFASTFNGEEIDASSFTGTDINIVAVFGIDPSNAPYFENSVSWYKATKGRMLVPGEENSILVNAELADKENLFIGSVVEINGENFRVVGIVDFELSIGFSYQLVVMNIDKARELSGYGDDEVGIINVLPDDTITIEKFMERLKDSLPNLSVFSSQQIGDMLDTFLGALSAALWFVSSIAAVVGGIVVMNTMLMSVMERIKEFGVLKAIGWRDSHVVLMVVGEAVIIGLLGGVSGVVFGFIGSALVQLITGIPTSISIYLILQVMFFSVAIGVVSSIYPAIIASRMSPIEAVTYE